MIFGIADESIEQENQISEGFIRFLRDDQWF